MDVIDFALMARMVRWWFYVLYVGTICVGVAHEVWYAVL